MSRLPGAMRRMRRLLGRRRRPVRHVGHAVKPAGRLVETLRPHLASVRPGDVVLLLLRAQQAEVAAAVAALRPDARVCVLARGKSDDATPRGAEWTRCGDPARRADFARRLPAPGLIVDADRRPFPLRWKTFSGLFLALRDGGTYVLVDPPASSEDVDSDVAATLLAGRLPEPLGRRTRDDTPTLRDAISLAEACHAVSLEKRALVVTKNGEHRFKLRERAANAVLDVRFGPGWGALVGSRPGYTYRSRAEVVGHGAGPTPEAGRTITVPELHLRRYRNPLHWTGQRLALENVFLPETFRHPSMGRLRHRWLVDGTSRHSRLAGFEPTSGRSLPGSYFFFDTEYPGHFGHVTTEVVSRYWGWLAAREADPDVRPLLSVPDPDAGVPDFQQRIFRALDVDPERAELIAPGECVRPEQLYAAGPMFAMPGYAATELADTWTRIADRNTGSPASLPARLFVSRRPKGVRRCTNTGEVEDFFTGAGFQVIYPEDFDFADQVAMFRRADVLAGFSGSGMFGMMWAAGKPTILISGHSYTASNEYLIGSVLGSQLHYFWGWSEVAQPPGRWSWKAFQSDFHFDVRAHADAIRAVLDEPHGDGGAADPGR